MQPVFIGSIRNILKVIKAVFFTIWSHQYHQYQHSLVDIVSTVTVGINVDRALYNVFTTHSTLLEG